jgi:type VI secretion system protein ImpK
MAMTSPPSLVTVATTARAEHSASRAARTLSDLMYDGFYMLFLLNNQQAPGDAAMFVTHIRAFLDEFERDARKLGAATEDIFDAKYAFCAAADECILRSTLSIRDLWERRPLQLAYFGDQLAGENFFEKLEVLRSHGATRSQTLEVFYLCLLLGFQGKYALEGTEKLGYLVARVGDELAHHKGKRTTFAPHWKAPDAVKHQLRGEMPLWAFAAGFALIGLVTLIGLRGLLGQQTGRQLAAYNQIVTQPPLTANITITLP